MLRILKHGSRQIFTMVCDECGCEFEYASQDCNTDYMDDDAIHYVVCPDCLHKNVLAVEIDKGE